MVSTNRAGGTLYTRRQSELSIAISSACEIQRTNDTYRRYINKIGERGLPILSAFPFNKFQREINFAEDNAHLSPDIIIPEEFQSDPLNDFLLCSKTLLSIKENPK